MRAAVRKLLVLGPLPPESAATEEHIRQLEVALMEIQPPLTDAEAEGLVGQLGDDSCFGLAWTLVHLIETAPGWPLEVGLKASGTKWVSVLRERASAANLDAPDGGAA